MTGIFDPATNTWRPHEDSGWYWGDVHPLTADCARGCLVHNPSVWVGNIEGWSYFPRADGRVERLCPHGIGHPDPDAVRYLTEIRGWSSGSAGAHGCDGCCWEEGND